MIGREVDRVEAIVVGAGAAGIAVSQQLAAGGVEHVVLERGRIGDTWRTRRWASFRMVSPNWANALPGQPLVGPAGEFASAAQFTGALSAFARALGLPVREHSPAISLRRDRAGYTVDTPDATYRARAVVVASGFQWYPRFPATVRQVPPAVLNLHASTYRRPEALPDGAVLVVGAGQSGLQIAEELARAGRRVLLCTSRVRRLPRRYRGRDMFQWWRAMGLLDTRTRDLTDPGIVDLPQPVLSGAAGGHSLSLHLLARSGVTLLGHLVRIDGNRLEVADDRDANIAYGDESAAAFRRQVDEFLGERARRHPDTEPDPADEPAALGRPPTDVRLDRAGVGTVIWATGYRAHHRWLRVPHDAPGLHMIGRPWLIRRTSGTLYGIPRDARIVSAAITRPAADGPETSATGTDPRPRIAAGATEKE